MDGAGKTNIVVVVGFICHCIKNKVRWELSHTVTDLCVDLAISIVIFTSRDGEDTEEAFLESKVGDFVIIRFDKGSEYDPNALRVCTHSGNLLGYIPKGNNAAGQIRHFEHWNFCLLYIPVRHLSYGKSQTQLIRKLTININYF